MGVTQVESKLESLVPTINLRRGILTSREIEHPISHTALSCILSVPTSTSGATKVPAARIASGSAAA